MRHLLYTTFCVALKCLWLAAMCKGLSLNNTDPAIVGGASHECYRECVAGDIRTCYYEFHLVEWASMTSQCGDCPYTDEDCFNRGCITAGGDPRPVNVVNYMLPGPSIQVCVGDIIQVNLTNTLGSCGTSIHWHGMSQTDTPYMDGVPFVTQCPILPGNTFLYNFTADPAGTHIYHSHDGYQDSDGFYGSLIIREPNDVHEIHYDYDLSEHYMMIWHWFETITALKMSTVRFGGIAPVGHIFTINGLAASLAYTENSTEYYTPKANFVVTQGYRYRFRIIDNSAIYCPVQISVDDHILIMIASDGASFQPTEVDSFIINAGERYDFVLPANQTVGNYWIRFRGLGLCSAVSSLAILHYESADDDEPSETTEYDDANRSGVLMGPIDEADQDYPNNTLIRVSELNNTMSSAQDVSGTPEHTFYVALGFNVYANYHTPGPYAQINNISFTFPSIPFLTQYNEITTDMYCTQDNVGAQLCDSGYCTCPYLYTMNTHSLVEIILIDTSEGGAADHPIHMHGHYFYVVASQLGTASDITVAEVQALNEAGLITKNMVDPLLKDVIAVPARGFVVIRVLTYNPGYWLMHCHVASHLEEGMAFILKVGEHSEMVHAPVGFPTCSGNYDITNPDNISSQSTYNSTSTSQDISLEKIEENSAPAAASEFTAEYSPEPIAREQYANTKQRL